MHFILLKVRPTLTAISVPGVHAAVDFLEVKGVDTTRLPELAPYEAMIRVAKHELDRSGLAVFLRDVLKRKPNPPPADVH